MTNTPIAETDSIQAGQIEPETLVHMGRLIRAFAEIEDIITLFLCRVSGISEGAAQIIIGQMSISTRLKKTKHFCDIKGGKSLNLYNKYFESQAFKDSIKVRNVVAHGKFVGIRSNGELVFILDIIHETIAGQLTVEAMSYPKGAFLHAATGAEDAIPILEKDLDVQKLRFARRDQLLRPHKKYRQKGAKAKPAQPQHQPTETTGGR